ncbi:MAG: NAD(P)/FAD-dependent oxidoreductase [Acidobacteriota bacterium]
MKKKINIIGAGIAGLSAGCYLQMNGYDTEIFELHNIPGGLCTAWERMGYTFDGCIHWLVGSGPGNNFYSLWNELVDMKNMEVKDHEVYLRVESEDPENYIDIFTDVNKLETELLAKAPEDKKMIKEFTGAIRKFKKLKLPVSKAREVMNMGEGLKMLFTILPYIGGLRKWGSMSLNDLSEKFNNPLLKKAVKLLFFPEMTSLFMVANLAWMSNRGAGYPLGGSFSLSKSMEKRYTNLGGKIHFNSRVKKIETNNNKATGITLTGGETLNSDITVSCADGYDTIFNMLEGKYLNRKIKGYYKNYKVITSYLQISMGIDGKFEGLPGHIYIPVDEGIRIDDSTITDSIGVRIFNFDPYLAPKGKTALTAMLTTEDFKYWVDLKEKNMRKYREEKKRIGEKVVEILEKRFGNISDRIEVMDVSTPSTVIRYTNNWKGSLEGWALTPDILLKQMDKTLPGLKGFYMAGQWVEPGGGLPTAMVSGRNVAQIICDKDDKKFKTTSF